MADRLGDNTMDYFTGYKVLCGVVVLLMILLVRSAIRSTR